VRIIFYRSDFLEDSLYEPLVVIEGDQPQDFTGFGCVRVRFRFR